MSNFPESVDIFTDKTGNDFIASSDPNNAFNGIEAVEGLIGALGKPQSWSTTLMTLIRKYSRGMDLTIDTGQVVVRKGEAVLESTDGNKLVFRRNLTDYEIALTDLDVGTVGNGFYYVFAKAPAAGTTAPFVFSTDFYAPSGIGTVAYSRIGWFYNVGGAGAISVTFCGNDKTENPNNPNVNIIQNLNPITTSSSAYQDIPGISINFYSSGRPVKFVFNGSIGGWGQDSEITYVQLLIDGTVKDSIFGFNNTSGADDLQFCNKDINYVEKALSVGTHVAKMQWKSQNGQQIVNYGGGQGTCPLTFIVEEL